MKLAKVTLAGLLAVGAASEISCSSPLIEGERKSILLREVERKPYLALFEGLQPFSGYRMKGLGKRLEGIGVMAQATSGNPSAHMPMIREAWKHNQKIYAGGFSMGENAARDLAEQCWKEGIQIEILFLMDGPCTGKIWNVKKAVDIKGNDCYGFRRKDRYTKSHCSTSCTELKYYILDSDHLGIPDASERIIRDEISRTMKIR